MFDVEKVRAQFPALAREQGGRSAVYFDGPAGSQTPRRVAEAVSRYMLECNANHGGVFATSRASDALLHEAHAAVADLLGADDPDTVIFGPNMTTLTFALSRSLSRTWKRGDEIIVTRLDHDANVTPWVLAARDAGAVVHHVGIKPDCTLNLTELQGRLSERTRLVALGCASNAVGTVNPFEEIVDWAHRVGALVFLDAVHYAPHRRIDVQKWNCDFLACSAYKFFGPHVGVLWGRRELLEKLPAYKVRPAPDQLPGRWMTGTQNHEGIAGVLEAVEYLADLGRQCQPHVNGRRAALAAAYSAIEKHEHGLASRFLDGLATLKPITLWGLGSAEQMRNRVATFSITHAHLGPDEVARRLDQEGIYAWHGNFYALSLSEALGREPDGMVRIGFLHYNTVAEVDRLLGALERMSS